MEMFTGQPLEPIWISSLRFCFSHQPVLLPLLRLSPARLARSFPPSGSCSVPGLVWFAQAAVFSSEPWHVCEQSGFASAPLLGRQLGGRDLSARGFQTLPPFLMLIPKNS